MLNCFFFNLIVDQPEITTDPGSTEIIERGDLTLTCSAVGNPTPSTSWTKDGSLVNAAGDPRINITEQNTKLRITNVSRADDGQYRCVASNGLGNATSNPATVDVKRKDTTREVVTLILVL